MKRLTGKLSRPFAVSLLLFLGLILVVTGQAQQRTVERKQAGPAEIKVDTRNATVAYIEGDHLVVRLENGRLEAIRIPAEERFNIDGEKHTLFATENLGTVPVSSQRSASEFLP